MYSRQIYKQQQSEMVLEGKRQPRMYEGERARVHLVVHTSGLDDNGSLHGRGLQPCAGVPAAACYAGPADVSSSVLLLLLHLPPSLPSTLASAAKTNAKEDQGELWGMLNLLKVRRGRAASGGAATRALRRWAARLSADLPSAQIAIIHRRCSAAPNLLFTKPRPPWLDNTHQHVGFVRGEVFPTLHSSADTCGPPTANMRQLVCVPHPAQLNADTMQTKDLLNAARQRSRQAGGQPHIEQLNTEVLGGGMPACPDAPHGCLACLCLPVPHALHAVADLSPPCLPALNANLACFACCSLHRRRRRRRAARGDAAGWRRRGCGAGGGWGCVLRGSGARRGGTCWRACPACL